MTSDELRRLAEEERKRLDALKTANEEINKGLESYGKSLKASIELQNQLNKIANIQKELQNRINKEKAKTIGRDEELIKELERQNEELSKSIKQTRELNKTFNTQRNIVKALGNDFRNSIGPKILNASVSGVMKFGGFVKASSNEYVKLSREIRNTTANIGLTNKLGKVFRDNALRSADAYALLNADLSEIAKSQETFSNSLGRNSILSSGDLQDIVLISKGSKLGFDNTLGILKNFNDIGISINRGTKFLDKTNNEVQRLGLNSGVFLDNFSQLLPISKSLNFNNGVKGLKDLLKTTQQVQLDFKNITNLSSKLFDIESAIEVSSNLQVLGGQFAAIADPFSLLFKARNAPEELAASIAKASENIAIFDSKTKQFKIPALELQRLKSVAEQLNIPFEELNNSILATATRTKALGQINPRIFNSEDRDFLANISKINKDGQFEINIGGNTSVLLKNIDNGILRSLRQNDADFKKIAESRKTFTDEVSVLFKRFQVTLFPFFERFTEKIFNKDTINLFEKRILKPLGESIANINIQELIKTGGDFIDFLNGEKFRSFIDTSTSLIKNVANLVTEFPKTTAAILLTFKSGLIPVLTNLIQLTAQSRGANLLGGSVGDAIGGIGFNGKNFGKRFLRGSLLTAGSSLLFEQFFGDGIDKKDLLSLIAPTVLAGLGTAFLGPGGGIAGGFLGGQLNDLIGFAEGGIPNKPMIAKVAEKGPEIITPIDKMKSYMRDVIEERDKSYTSNSKTNISIPTDFNINISFRNPITLDSPSLNEDVKREMLKDPSFVRELSFIIKDNILKSMQGNRA